MQSSDYFQEFNHMPIVLSSLSLCTRFVSEYNQLIKFIVVALKLDIANRIPMPSIIMWGLVMMAGAVN